MKDLLFDFGTWLRNKAYPSPKIEFYTDVVGLDEFAPIASNDTPEGKGKNRRIEVILTPKLDEVSKLLNDVK